VKILHVTNSMNPAYGGLSTALGALVPALNALGHSSEIVSLDSPAAGFLGALPFPVHALGPVRPGYGYSARLKPWLAAQRARFHAVIVHGLWQHHGRSVHQACAAPGGPPYFVFPHGMLDPWFKREHPLRHVRKWCYWWVAERALLRGAAAVLFTCEEERRLARQSFPGSSYRERVVAFGTTAPPYRPAKQCAAFFALHPGLADRPFWLFLGRLHPKKGVDLLIDAYARLSARGSPVPRLVLAGPCADPSYLQRLQARAAATCPPGAVLWPGMLAGDAKWGALRAAEVFVLPSHQENFGLAVVEALACGTPVLISDQVNIWRELAADGAGLVEPDTADGTARLLARWGALDDGGRARLRRAAQESFQHRYEIRAAAQSLLGALAEAAVARDQP
jgi:glycosyltransferase involved in cell wall biosynthesis